MVAAVTSRYAPGPESMSAAARPSAVSRLGWPHDLSRASAMGSVAATNKTQAFRAGPQPHDHRNVHIYGGEQYLL